MNDKEIWKTHKKGYEISSHGRIKNKYKEGFRKQVVSTSGYVLGTFGGESKYFHIMVVETFIGEVPKGLQVNHIDGNKRNNRLSNLEVVTRSQNMKHAFENGLVNTACGERNGMSVLKKEQVLEIYDLIIAGKSNDDIATIYNLHSRYVSLIRHGKRWSDLYQEHEISKNDFSELRSPNVIKLSKAEKFQLLADMKGGMQNMHIAEKYGLDRITVSHVRKGNIWKSTIAEFESALSVATTIESATQLETVV